MHAILLKLHRWTGLVSGVLVLVLALTGCALVFEEDIDRALNRRLTVVEPGPRSLSLAEAVEVVRAARPAAVPTGIALPERPHYALVVVLADDQAVGVDPYEGRVLGSRHRLGGFARELRRLHKTLLAGNTGSTVAGVVTLLTLMMAASGLVLWWPRRVFGVKRSRYWRRVNLDLHNVLGLYSAAVLVVICVTGAMVTWADTIDPLLMRLDGPPPAKRPRPVSVVREGSPPIDPDEAVRMGRAALPGAAVTRVNLPPPGPAVYRVGMRFPEDRTPGGRSFVLLDQYSGTVVGLESSRAAGLGKTIVNYKRSVHTGDVFGAPTRALAFVVSLALAGQVVTGFFMWWRPGRIAAGRLAGPARDRSGAAA